ncbi:hypothetical protein P4050_18625 [Pseudomonas aeruginosa]|nr:hypothetical protein [Pseudomonas aeruginosa]
MSIQNRQPAWNGYPKGWRRRRPILKALVETLQTAADNEAEVIMKEDPFAADPPPERHAQQAGQA